MMLGQITGSQEISPSLKHKINKRQIPLPKIVVEVPVSLHVVTNSPRKWIWKAAPFFSSKKTCKKTNGPTFFSQNSHICDLDPFWHHLGNPATCHGFQTMKRRLLMVGIYINSRDVTIPKRKKNMLWIIHGHHRIFVKNLPETFPENSHTRSSVHVVFWALWLTKCLDSWCLAWVFARNENPTTRRLRLLHPLTMIEIFCLPPPLSKAPKAKSTKVPLTSGFKLGLCGMVSFFFGGGVVRVVWNPIFSSSFCCFSPTWAPPTTTQFLRKAKKSWGPGWLRFVVQNSLQRQTSHFLKRFRDFFGLVENKNWYKKSSLGWFVP